MKGEAPHSKRLKLPTMHSECEKRAVRDLYLRQESASCTALNVFFAYVPTG